jgi:hypothetical protein
MTAARHLEKAQAALAAAAVLALALSRSDLPPEEMADPAYPTHSAYLRAAQEAVAAAQKAGRD